jgi:uncharacterized protein YqeY
MLQDQISQDLKTALLAGNKLETSVLRSIKSAITYAEVAKGAKGKGSLGDAQILEILAKESKKRQESADVYNKGGAQDRADAELEEKAIIDKYLPAQLSREEIEKLVDAAVAEFGEASPAAMGRIIGLVKQKAGSSADGAVIAAAVKERLSQ